MISVNVIAYYKRDPVYVVRWLQIRDCDCHRRFKIKLGSETFTRWLVLSVQKVPINSIAPGRI